jgi:phosphatidylglycerol:prolipoprotein diacylglycerol transferase
VLPYVEQPVLDLGFHQIPLSSVLFGAAIVTEFAVSMRRATRLGIDREKASSLIAWATLIGLASAHVFDVLLYYPERLLENPLELLRFWGGISSYGGMIGGLAGLAWVMQRRRMTAREQLRFVDCLIYALPFTLAIGRLGCAALHDHPGVSSDHFLAVSFPDGPRFDLGLLEAFYAAALAAVFAWLGRRPRPDGFFVGLFFLLYGPGRFLLDSLRVSEARYFDWTPGQYLSLLAVAVGAWTLFAVLRARPRPASG